jgi:hypothetical protein
MQRRTRWIAGFSAVLLTFGMVASVAGYDGQVPGSITVAACGPNGTVTATVLDATGQPIDGQSVVWSLIVTVSPQDTLGQTPTTTNVHGVATTTVTLAPVDGNRTIRAVAGDIAGQAVFQCFSGETQGITGLPATSTLPATAPATPVGPGWALLVLGAAFLAGAGLMLRRLAPTHR